MTKFYAQYSDEYTVDVLTPDAIKQIYRKEVQAATKNGTYMGIWQLHAVASILGTVIFSVYPEYGGHNVRCHFHRLLQPRIPAASTSRDAAAKLIPGIMWTRTDGKKLPEAVWRPNHFVACRPGNCTPFVVNTTKGSYTYDEINFEYDERTLKHKNLFLSRFFDCFVQFRSAKRLLPVWQLCTKVSQPLAEK